MRRRLPPPNYNPPPMFGLRMEWPGQQPGYYSPGPSGIPRSFIASDSFAPAHVVLPSDFFGPIGDGLSDWSIYDAPPDFRDFSVQVRGSINTTPHLPLVVLPDGRVAQFPDGLNDGDTVEMRTNGQVLINGVEVQHNLSALSRSGSDAEP